MNNRFNPKKLKQSKWTSIQPKNKEKHFMVTEIEIDENQIVVNCVIEAMMTKNEYTIQWSDLKDSKKWAMGWK